MPVSVSISKRGLSVASAWLVLALITDFVPPIKTPFIGLSVLLACLVFADLMVSIKRSRLEVQRYIDQTVPVQVWVPSALKIHNPGKHKIVCQIHEHHGDEVITRSLPAKVVIEAGAECDVNYRVKPLVRGNLSLTLVDILFDSMFKIWHIKKSFPVSSELKVQPNYKAIFQFNLFQDDKLNTTGGRRLQRRRGEGTEFHQLREYQSGDPIKKIDWKASSRTGKLISKEYQDEQDQQVVFLLDTGRRMRHEENNRRFMDETMNAMLLLSHTAAQQGDAVGFMAFGQHDNWCPPRKHKSIVKHIVDHCYDIHAGLVHSDYLISAQRLLELQKRRAMVILLTNTRDEDTGDLEKAVALLRKRHLVVIADLQEGVLGQVTEGPIEDFEEAITWLATKEYLDTRKEMKQSLIALGALYLDCTVEDLPAQLMDTYHKVKHSGRL